MAFLRPNGDNSAGGWTDEGGSGTDIYQSIDETSASDADYAQSSENPVSDTWSVTLSNPTSGVDTAEAVTIRYRVAKYDAGLMDLDVVLKEGATTRASWSHTLTETITTHAQTLSSGEKASITDWDNLTLEFTATEGYSVDSISPEFVADYVNEYYRAGDVDSDFDTTHDYTGASLSTMVDSSGNLKWKPQNLIANSENFSSWTANFGTVVTSGATGPSGSADAYTAQDPGSNFSSISTSGSIVSGVQYALSIFVKSEASPTSYPALGIDNYNASNDLHYILDHENGAVVKRTGYPAADSTSVVAFGDFWRFTLVFTAGSTGSKTIYFWPALSSILDGSVGGSPTGTRTIFGAQLTRADLGGTANNLSSPITSSANDYVSTSGSPVYGPRRSSHVYNGTSWVNRGIQLESAAATNLDPNSRDLSAWTTSGTTITKNQTGPDGVANSAHLIAATGANGTALEQITAASADHAWGCLMKRVTGTGTIEVTVDGGTTWVDVTSDINSSEYVQVSTGPGITVTNPEFGVRIGTSGDEVAVDISQLEQTSGYVSSPIPTDGSTVTRVAETLSVPTAQTTPSTTALSIQMDGLITYVDESEFAATDFYIWGPGTDQVRIFLQTTGGDTGQPNARTVESGGLSTSSGNITAYSPGINVPFNVAARHTDSDVCLAVDGTAASASADTAIPNLSAQDCTLISDKSAFISQFRLWENDGLTDTQLETATS